MTWNFYSDKVMNVKREVAVTVTDPCYDKGSGLNIHLPTGEYACFYDESDEGCWGVRIARSAILRTGISPSSLNWLSREHIGSVGVDAGLCGYFINKPDYDDRAWQGFCNYLEEADRLYGISAYHTPEGFFTSSGYGDGEYGVYLIKDGEKVVGLEIVFIEPPEDEEDEEEYLYDDEEDEED